MTDRPAPSATLEKRSYRKRRLLDGLKILPIFATFLFLVPILGSQGAEHRLPSLLAYLFSVWFGLCMLCGVLAAWVSEPTPSQPPGTEH